MSGQYLYSSAPGPEGGKWFKSRLPNGTEISSYPAGHDGWYEVNHGVKPAGTNLFIPAGRHADMSRREPDEVFTLRAHSEVVEFVLKNGITGLNADKHWDFLPSLTDNPDFRREREALEKKGLNDLTQAIMGYQDRIAYLEGRCCQMESKLIDQQDSWVLFSQFVWDSIDDEVLGIFSSEKKARDEMANQAMLKRQRIDQAIPWLNVSDDLPHQAIGLGMKRSYSPNQRETLFIRKYRVDEVWKR